MAKHVKLHETQGAYDFFAQQAEDSKAALAKAEADLTEFSHAYFDGGAADGARSDAAEDG